MKSANQNNKQIVSVVDLGCSNIFSICTAIERIGATAVIASSAKDITDANILVLPGVGTFAEGVKQLDHKELRQSIRERILRNRPTAAICLGMQLLFSGSEESPGIQGIGIIAGTLEAVEKTSSSPVFGWSTIGEAEKANYMYFAHSFCTRSVPTEWSPLKTNGAKPYIAMITKGNILGCQFHPEISGVSGELLLKSWFRDMENQQ